MTRLHTIRVHPLICFHVGNCLLTDSFFSKASRKEKNPTSHTLGGEQSSLTSQATLPELTHGTETLRFPTAELKMLLVLSTIDKCKGYAPSTLSKEIYDGLYGKCPTSIPQSSVIFFSFSGCEHFLTL